MGLKEIYFNLLNKLNMESKLSKREKELIKKDISKLEYNELMEVYKLIKHSTDKISKNKNGIFINLKYVPDDTLSEVRKFIKFRKEHKELLDNYETSDKTIDKNNEKHNDKPIEDIDSVQINTNNIMNNTLQIDETKEQPSIDEKFCFQSFVEKLSINSHKLFPSEYNSSLKTNNKIIQQPITTKNKFSGVKSRLLKKCRDIHCNIRNEEITSDMINEDVQASENIEKIRQAHKYHSIGFNDDSSTDSEKSDKSQDDEKSINDDDSEDSDAISTAEDKLLNLDDNISIISS